VIILIFKRRKTEVIEDKEFISAKNSSALVELIEKERGEFKDAQIEIVSAERVVRISNRLPTPIFDVKLHLKNIENTTLPKEIMLPKLGSYGKEDYIYEKTYNVKKYKAPVFIACKVLIPNMKGNILWYNESNEVQLAIDIRSNIQVPINRVVVEYFPGRDVTDINVESQANITKHTDRIIWTIENLQPQATVSQKFILNVNPSEKEVTELGYFSIKAMLEDGTFSEVSIDHFEGKLLLMYEIEKREHEEESGLWDVGILLKNPYDTSILAEGEIEISGKIISKMEIPDVKLVQNRLVLEKLAVAPKSDSYLGPITVKSVDPPSLKVRIWGRIKEEIIMYSEGIYRVTLPKLHVIAVELKKSAQPIVDKRLRKYVQENEIPTLGQNAINITTEVLNIGGTGIGYLEIVDIIPPGLSNPENLVLEINGKPVQKFEKEIINADNIKAERKLIIRLRGDNVFPKDARLRLRYSLVPKSLGKNVLELVFPSHVVYSPYPEIKPRTISLSETDAPYVRMKFITRNVKVSKQIETLDTDVFLLKIIVENKGDAPVIDYNVIQRVPLQFEILETTPKAQIITEKDKMLVQWKLDLEPGEQKELNLRLRGKGKYSVSELLHVEAI